jgi:hypothetical protein
LGLPPLHSVTSQPILPTNPPPPFNRAVRHWKNMCCHQTFEMRISRAAVDYFSRGGVGPSPCNAPVACRKLQGLALDHAKLERAPSGDDGGVWPGRLGRMGRDCTAPPSHHQTIQLTTHGRGPIYGFYSNKNGTRLGSFIKAFLFGGGLNLPGAVNSEPLRNALKKGH